MSKISGYQVVSAEPKGNCFCVTIEIQGCKFSGVAQVQADAKGDPYQAAFEQAVIHAKKQSDQSDFKLFGRGGGGFGGGSFGKRPPADPAAQANSGAIGAMFKLGLKEKGYKRKEIQELIAELTGIPYREELENQLTNAQVDALTAKITAGERAQNAPIRASFRQKDDIKRLAKDRGMSSEQLDSWLAKSGVNWIDLTSHQAERALEALQERAA